jgi:ComF family protein
MLNVLCGHCLSHTPYFDQVYSPFLYSDALGFLIRQLKYQKKIHYARVLANLFIQQVEQLDGFSLPDVLIPVPMHKQRLRTRGFNQALELSRELSAYFDVPIDYKSLSRHRNTPVQAGLTARHRQKNMKNAFSIQKTFDFKRVALIDDVMTTGSTVNEAAKILKQHGAAQVDIWTIARAGLKH